MWWGYAWHGRAHNAVWWSHNAGCGGPKNNESPAQWARLVML